MNGARVLLGVCGGIAAYKAASLASRLVQRGVELDVILTESAQRFVTPLTFSALTRRHVYVGLWDRPETIPHITLVRENRVFAIVPATANAIASLALGLADDLLTNCALAARIPLVVAPAMNSAMLAHPATQAHLATLRARGVTIVEPGTGFLAERESGPGRLADEDAIVAAIEAALSRTQSLAGQRVLITAGPTREPLDPARFLSNGATGTTGIALADEALARGANVTLILGPTDLDAPPAAQTTRVMTAQEMHDATLAHADGVDVAIATAAVADYRPASASVQKVKKTDEPQTLALERTPDVLAALSAHVHASGARTFLVGFALESQDAETYAREKLKRKALDAIAANTIAPDSGFGRGENALVLLYGEDGRVDLGRAPKAELARRLWDAIETLRANGRA